MFVILVKLLSPFEAIAHVSDNEEYGEEFDGYSDDFENEESEIDGLKELSPVLFKQVSMLCIFISYK